MFQFNFEVSEVSQDIASQSIEAIEGQDERVTRDELEACHDDDHLISQGELGQQLVLTKVPPPLEYLSTHQANYHSLDIVGHHFEFIDIRESSLPHPTIDLIPGTYEGGFKLWEASCDLCEYLIDEFSLSTNDDKRDRASCRVLELGCGHGLPGITALQLGYKDVFFSDFNADVLHDVTWPNILKNVHDREAIPRIECWAGDWDCLVSEFTARNLLFDVILTAETLYNERCCQKVYNIIDHLLSPNGVAILATKRYYFGVGGGTHALEQLLQVGERCDSKRRMSWRIAKAYDDGKSNIREILVISS